ncbi:hypothetical protein [Kineococcus auxinigenes]|uniref:hypothetical protein n=1 Tax=unclassified Kineococcus TaxID=2621656 RepID=UPI003D7DA4F7
MPDLRLDTTDLERAATGLDAVARALAGTDTLAGDGAGDLGHDGAAAALRRFAESSTRRRDELGRAVEEFAGHLRECVSTFDGTERSLAEGLGGAA